MAYSPGGGAASPRVALPWWVVIGGLAVIGVGGTLVGGLGGDSGTTAAPTSTSPSPSATSEAPSTTPLATTSSTAPSTAVPAPPTTAPPTTTAAPTSSGVDFVMPDLMGSDLQSAQNAVQELGVFYSVSHDLLGSRNQVIDSNWIVCDQNVAPGERVTGEAEGQLDFGVVKREEACP